MIRVKEKPITTSKKKHVIPNAAEKRKSANKRILVAVLEEQRRQNRGLSYCSLRVVK